MLYSYNDCISSFGNDYQIKKSVSDKVDKAQLIKCFEILIFSDKGMRENNLSDIIRRVKSTFSNKNYISNLSTSRKNWLSVDNNTVINGIIAFLSDLNL